MVQGFVSKTLEGRNGRLFIGDYGAPDTDAILVERPFQPQRLNLWRANLSRHAAWLAERAIPLVVLVAPDAFTACPDDLPEGWPRPGPIGQPFAEALAGVPNLEVVFPLAALTEARGGLVVYKKTDTHWSAYGALVAYRELLKALPASLDVRRVEPRDVTFALKPTYGNLGVNVDRKEAIPFPTVSGGAYETVYRATGADRRGLLVTRCSGGGARALILRDSFATEMGPYLSASFGEAWSFGPVTALDPDMVIASRPDVVIFQTSERRLLRFDPHHEELGWRERFEVDLKTPAGKAFGRLHQAAEAREFEAAADLAAAVAEADGLQPHHLIHCALACSHARRHAESTAYARRALRLDRSFASAWRLVALAALAQRGRRDAAWAGAARKMIRLAPENALYRGEYAQGLVKFGRVEDGVADLRAAIARFPDYPQLRIQLARVLERSGEREEAVGLLDAAIELMPAEMTRLGELAETLRRGGTWAAPDAGA
jgi:tetratricopeptide (TPR) repeat protein